MICFGIEFDTRGATATNGTLRIVGIGKQLRARVDRGCSPGHQSALDDLGLGVKIVFDGPVYLRLAGPRWQDFLIHHEVEIFDQPIEGFAATGSYRDVASMRVGTDNADEDGWTVAGSEVFVMVPHVTLENL